MKTEDPNMMSNQELFSRANKVMPGGVSHELRYKTPHPMYVNRAEGPLKWDVEGKQYIDYKMGSASQMLGYSHPDVLEAINKQIALTPYTGDCNTLEIEWAEIIQRLFPSAELVRFTSSGTEATLLALRVARAHSGKPKVLRIDGHFHGWHDNLLKGSKPGQNTPPSLGVPEAISDLVVIAPADLQTIARILAADDEIGTVFVEASGANYGSVPLPDGFLPGIRALTTNTNTVLVFDEVITGFRWSPGGRQARDNVVPDLTTLAKVVTGGLPGGALCGKADIMQLLSPGEIRDGIAPPVSHKGTFNAAPLVAAAALATLKHLETGAPQAHADAMADRLRKGLREIFARLGIQGAVYGESSTFHMYFGACDGTVNGLSPRQSRLLLS